MHYLNKLTRFIYYNGIEIETVAHTRYKASSIKQCERRYSYEMLDEDSKNCHEQNIFCFSLPV